MKHPEWLEGLQKNVADLIARSPAADVERNVRAVMAQAFTRMDLVTREEFDVQADLLARLRERVDALTAQVRALEARLAGGDASDSVNANGTAKDAAKDDANDTAPTCSTPQA